MKYVVVCRVEDRVGIGHYLGAWSTIREQLLLRDIDMFLCFHTSSLKNIYGDWMPKLNYPLDDIVTQEQRKDEHWGWNLSLILRRLAKHSRKVNDELSVLIVSDLYSIGPAARLCMSDTTRHMLLHPLRMIPYPAVDIVLHIRSGDFHLFGKKLDIEMYGSSSITAMLHRVREIVEEYLPCEQFHCISDNQSIVDYARSTFPNCIAWQNKQAVCHSAVECNETLWSDALAIAHAKKVIVFSSYDFGSSFSRFWAFVGNTQYEKFKFIPRPVKKRCIGETCDGKRCGKTIKTFYPFDKKKYVCNIHSKL